MAERTVKAATRALWQAEQWKQQSEHYGESDREGSKTIDLMKQVNQEMKRALWQAEQPRRRRSIFVLRTKVRTKADFFQIKNEMADGRHLVFEYVHGEF